MSDLKALDLTEAILALQVRSEISLGLLLGAVFLFLLIALIVLVIRDFWRWFLGVSELSARVRRLEAEVARLREAPGVAESAAGPVVRREEDRPGEIDPGPRPEGDPA